MHIAKNATLVLRLQNFGINSYKSSGIYIIRKREEAEQQPFKKKILGGLGFLVVKSINHKSESQIDPPAGGSQLSDSRPFVDLTCHFVLK